MIIQRICKHDDIQLNLKWKWCDKNGLLNAYYYKTFKYTFWIYMKRLHRFSSMLH